MPAVGRPPKHQAAPNEAAWFPPSEIDLVDDLDEEVEQDLAALVSSIVPHRRRARALAGGAGGAPEEGPEEEVAFRARRGTPSTSAQKTKPARDSQSPRAGSQPV
jgi:hypothetical protein